MKNILHIELIRHLRKISEFLTSIVAVEREREREREKVIHQNSLLELPLTTFIFQSHLHIFSD